MYVCICAAVTDRQIKQAVCAGASSLDDLTVQLGVGAGCGCCRGTAQEVLDEAADSALAMPVMHVRELTRVAVLVRPV